jgi:hypothetical protein
VDRIQKDIILTRISSGIHIFQYGDRTLFIYPPTRLVKQLSYQYYSSVLDSLLFEPWLSKEDAQSFLIQEGLISTDIDNQIEKFEKKSDDLKLQAYENRLNPPKVKLCKMTIRGIENTMTSLLSAKHSLDHLTKEGYAEQCRQNFLIMNSIKDKQGIEVSIDDDALFSESLFSSINKSRLNNNDIREIARTDPWRSIWNSSDNNIFGTSPVDWTEDQKTLILYTKMYDNAYKHSECPEDNIIEDNDLFDGWMIYQRNKAKEEKREAERDRVVGGKNYDEHFLFPENEEHRRQIDNMNDAQGRSIRQQREKALELHKKLKEDKLPDVEQELRMQANKMIAARMKGK